MNELDLTIPDQGLTQDNLDPKPKAGVIAAWLDELPLVNPEHCIRLLCNYLTELNRCQLDYSERFKALELLRLICFDLAVSLRGKYAQASLPLSNKNEKFYEGAIDINRMLCIGYKIVIADTQQKNIQSSKDKIVVYAYYHAMQQLSYIMLECYLVYRPIPVNTWKECHRLYKKTAEQNALDILIPIETSNNQTETIAISYKRTLLLSLTNPYHLMQDEARSVFRLLTKLSQGLNIKPFPENESLSGGFAIDLKSDHSPVFLSSERNANLFEPRLLDINQLVDALKSHMLKLDTEIEQQIESNQSSLAIRLRYDLMLRLHDSWSRSHERSEQRQTTLGFKDMIISLSTTHYHISDKVPYNPELDEIKTYANEALKPSGLSLVPIDHEPWRTDEAEERLEKGIDQPRSSNFDAESNLLDKWEKIYSATSSREHDEINQNPNQTEKYTLSSWQIKNQSPTGLSLFCQSDHCLPVRVGELMSFRDNQMWVIGIIRWLHAHSDESIELGIMLISHHCRAIATRAITGIGKGGEYMRSLVIDTDKPDCKKLLLPAAIYHTGTELVINSNGVISYVRLTKQLLSTKSLNLFEYIHIEMPDTESRNINALRQLLT